jgi:hypothetical protein
MGENIKVTSVQRGWVAWDATIPVPSGLSEEEFDEFLETDDVWTKIYDPKNFRVISLEEIEREITRDG